MHANRSRAALALSLALAGGMLSAAPAMASDGEVSRAGNCSAASDWKVKAHPDNRRLQVEFEVDSNRVGQTWSWRLADNGTVVARGTSRTTGPSGSFEVNRRIANRAGQDTVRFRATNAASGESCTGAVRL